MISVDPNTAGSNALRRAGLIVILYAFMQSYYGVGSLRNSLGSAPLSGPGFFLALAFGLCWLGLFLGGLLLVFRNRIGLPVARAAAWISALVQIAGIALFWRFAGQDLRGFLFTFSPPLYGLFLAFALMKLARDEEPGREYNLPPWTIIASGAVLPWIAALGVKLFSAAPIAPPKGTGLFIPLFMTLWCAIPFGVLAMTVRAWPAGSSRKAVLACGFAGSAVASLYCYGLIWTQTMNSFIMALLPPVVFAGQALGISGGLLYVSRWVSEPR